jgi:hypothetical protein
MQVSTNSFYNVSTNYSAVSNEKSDENKSEYDELKESEKDKKAEEARKKAQGELTQEEKQVVSELQARDSEVRAHEAAHQSGGASTGAASFTYQKGPDGKMYAIGGEVPVNMKAGSTPEETIANAQAVIASALAPADPSGQDQAVAASAAMMIAKAQQQIAKEKQEEMMGKEVYKNEADTQNSSQNNETKSIEPFDISA